MTFYNREGMLYARINGKRISTKLKYSKENIKLFTSYSKNDEFFSKFNVDNINIPTVIELCEEVLEEKEAQLKPTSMCMYRSMFKTYIVPYFNKRIDEIEPLDIDKWYKNFTNKSGIITSESVLKPAFEKAILRKYITTSPFVITKPRIKSDYKINPFTLKEIELLLYNTKGWFKNFIGLCFFTGARTGEILALKWCDINFNNYTIDINKTQTNGFTQSPKTESSIRIIDMLPQSEDFLKNQRKETGLREYVFLPKGKKICTSSYLTPTWNNLLIQVGLEHRGIYQTRHSFASNMLSNKEDLNWVSQTLGHKNPGITQQKYFKYIPVKRNERKNTFLDTIDTKSAQST